MIDVPPDRATSGYRPDDRVQRTARRRLVFVLVLSGFLLVVAGLMVVWMYILGAPIPA